MNTIKLKESKELDFSKMFPIVDESLYKLIEGKELKLSSTVFNQLDKSKTFKIGNIVLPTDVIQVNERPKVISVIEKCLSYVNTKSLFMDDLVEAICQGIALRENVMLYGKGGHNKSEGTLQVLDYLYNQGILKDKPFIKSLGDGTTVEDLFGGVKMKKALEDGIIEYNTENSFMEHPIVIFEECFDAPPQVLLALKDIMSSGKFRNGNQVVDIKTKVFIALTNRSKREISKDDSSEALAQRFGITAKIEWEPAQYNAANFLKLFKITAKSEKWFNDNIKKLRAIAALCESSCLKGGDNFISPRSAVKAARLYVNGGSLSLISEFDKNDVETFEKDGVNSTEEIKNQREFLDSIITFIDEHSLLSIASKSTASDIIKRNSSNASIESKNKINYVLSILSMVTWDSTIINSVGSLTDRLLKASKTL